MVIVAVSERDDDEPVANDDGDEVLPDRRLRLTIVVLLVLVYIRYRYRYIFGIGIGIINLIPQLAYYRLLDTNLRTDSMTE